MPTRHIKRAGWSRYVPRHPRQLGNRGKVLLVFGVAWLFIGLGVPAESGIYPVDTIPHIMLLDPEVRVAAWVATGLIAIGVAFRPPGFTDAPGWPALYVMPATRTVSFFLAWTDSLLPWGGEGYGRGWVPAATYFVMVLAVFLCSGWPDPPLVAPAIADESDKGE